MTRAYHEINQLSSQRSPVVPSGGSEPHGYISADNLAALSLASVPTTKRGVNKLAARSGWRFIDRIGRGGGRLYAIADLPQAARDELLRRRLEAIDSSAPSRGRPAGSGYFDCNPDIADAVVAMIAERRQPARALRAKIAVSFPEHNPPSIRAIQRFVAAVECQRQAELASLRDPDAFKGRYRLALGRADGSATHANQVWELDTTTADVMTLGGRKAILGLIDRYSRRAAFMVAESESGQSVRRFLVDTIRGWGVMPDAVMTDNGSGYINQSIRSALEALGIEHRICPPGSPEKKPYIERLFGTFTRERAALLDGFAGHNVSDAQRIRAKARKDSGRAVIEAHMSPEELQAVLTNWLDGEYHQREHGTTRMAPLARWLACRHPRTMAPSEDVLRIALSAMVGERTVGKRGIRWKEGRYWSPALAAWMGRTVIVRRDEDELGELFVFAPDHSFIDIAINHERAGVSEEEYARAARAEQDEFIRRARADIRAKQRRFDPAAMRDKLLRADAAAAGKLAVLPVRGTTPSTPAIDSLSEATAGGLKASAGEPTFVSPREASAAVVQLRTPEQKMRDADELIARAEAGEAIDAAALRKAQLYRGTSEYRAQRALADAFGPTPPHQTARGPTQQAG